MVLIVLPSIKGRGITFSKNKNKKVIPVLPEPDNEFYPNIMFDRYHMQTINEDEQTKNDFNTIENSNRDKKNKLLDDQRNRWYIKQDRQSQLDTWLRKNNITQGGSLLDEINELIDYENELRQILHQINNRINLAVQQNLNSERISLLNDQNILVEQIQKLRKHINKIERELNSPEP